MKKKNAGVVLRGASTPSHISVAGKAYRIAVIRIFDRDAKGRPAQCMFVHDDQAVSIKGGEEFLTAFVPANMLEGGN